MKRSLCDAVIAPNAAQRDAGNSFVAVKEQVHVLQKEHDDLVMALVLTVAEPSVSEEASVISNIC
jgi:hypothetical protein